MSIKKGSKIISGAPLEPVWGTISGNITDQEDLQQALAQKVSVDSPAFTGTPTSPTPPLGSNNDRIATTSFVERTVSGITGLPSQTGHTGKFLKTNGSEASWASALTPNTPITGATHTKITYDSNGLVTAGTDLEASDIPSLTLSKISDVTATASEVNVLDGITATTEELNILDGVTASASEINVLDGITASTAELNILDGATLTTTELNYVDGVTSSIQTQLDNKIEKNNAITGDTKCKITYDSKGLVTAGADLSASDIPSLTLSKISDVTATASEVNVLDGITASTEELNYVDGVTSNIQTQLDNKVEKNDTITGATHTKITYDSKGLVTAGTDLEVSDIPSLTLSKISDVTATAAEVNVLDGITASTAELNYVDGVTSSIQTQLDNKVEKNDDIISATKCKITYDSKGLVTAGADLSASDIPSLTLSKISDVTATASEVNVLDGITATTTELNVLDGITATTTELNYVDGVTSNIQTQLDSKVAQTDSVSKVYGTDENGNQTTYDVNSFGAVDDVKVGTQSVVTNKIANLGTMAGEATSDYYKKTDLANIATSGSWTDLSNTPTTISGYGITDAYTKTQIDGMISGVFHYKGSKETYSQLPTTGNVVGDVWNIEQADTTHGIKAGDNVCWNGTTWDVLSGIVDLSTYDNHIANTNNPHSVTKAQVGLGNVDNTSDVDKPISTATQTALDGKVDKTSTANQIYGTAAANTQTTYTIDKTATANTVAQRDTNGVLKVGTPSSNADATTKKYVDDADDLKVDKVTTASKIYGTDAQGAQTTYDVSNVTNTVVDVTVDGTSVVTNKIAELGSMAGESKDDYEPVISLTTSRALISNSSGKVAVSDVTSTELSYLDGVTSNIQTQLDDKVTKNDAITGATKCKITYDSKGLVTAGADLSASDIPSLTLSKISDVTASATEVNVLDGITASTAELNILDGATLTTTELNYVDGVTSSIQTQLDNKVASNDAITGATKCKITYDSKGLVTGGADLEASDIPSLTLSKISDVTASATEVNVLDGITATTTELNYVDGVTSSIQTQLDNKVTKNNSITGATKCKITYDSKGLVTAGADLSASDIPSLTLSKISDVTATATEVNVLDGITASTAELNILDGATLTTTELNYVDGVTSSIQTQLDNKVDETSTENQLYGTDGSGEQTTWTLSNSTTNSSVALRTSTGTLKVSTPTANDDATTKLYVDTEVGNKVTANDAITGATKCKITYDSKGLVTAGADLSASDIPSLTLSKISDVTATATEVNVLDGITASTEELNILDGVTASTAELNILDGATLTTTELNYVDGVTSSIQTQLDNKVTKNNAITGNTKCKITYDSKGLVTAGADLSASDIPSLTLSKISDVTATATEVNVLDGITASTEELNILDGATLTTTELNVLDGITATTTELNYVDGVTSAIQTQLDNKVTKNDAITGATKCKITYDSKGLVTAGADLEASDIPSLTLSKISDVTATASELNILDGATLTTTELNYVDGVTSPIQTQIGTLSSLTTDAQTSLVAAINEIDSHTDTNTSNISTINGLIPSEATTSNQLADKAFVNSSIATNTANFIGTFSSVAELEAYSGTLTNNDYAFVEVTDTYGNNAYDRYKYTTSTNPASWQFEYELNNSSFTAAQWAAINSGATTTNIGQITTNENAIGTLSSLTTTAKTDLVSAINELDTDKVEANSAITGATKCKITYDAKGLVTAGADLSASDIPSLTLSKISDVTATATEVNVLDGITASTAELNILDGVTADASELNILDGATLTTTELNYVDGVTSSIQTQLDNKVEKNNAITGATKCKITYDSKGLVTAGADLSASDIPSLTLSKISDVTASASEVNVLDGITASTAELNILDGVTASASEINVLDGITATTTELNYVDGVTSSIQTQLDGKVASNLAITGATKCKITYDAKGLVTAGADLEASDIPDLSGTYQTVISSTNKISADYISDGTTNKTVTATEKSTWSGKQDAITGAATTITSSDLTASRALVSNGSGKVAVSSVTSTELGYLSGVTSAIQTQIGNKQDTLVSGTNIKTINNQSILGSGNIEIQGGTTVEAYTAAEVDTIWNSITPTSN